MRLPTWTASAAAVLLLALPSQPALRADTYEGRTLVSIAACPEEAHILYGLGVDIVGRREDRFKALVTPGEMESLKSAGLPFEILHGEMARDRELFASPGRCPQPNGAPCYYTASKFDTVNPPAGSLMEHLLQLHLAHPEITRLHDIGNSADGAFDIVAMQVSENPDAVEPEPKVRIYANIHGDEVGGLMVATDALDWVLANYPSDARARRLVEEADLWFVPMGNPWGNSRSSRYNSRGKDLNRNFQGPAGCDAPPCFSEAETQAIRDLTEVMGKRFACSLSYHGGAICFNSVYNYTSAATSDEPIFFSSRTGGPYGDAVPSPEGLAEAYRLGNTTPGFWYTNGADWYITRGDTNDWSYAFWSALDTTVEVSEVKWPDSSFIPALQTQHREATLNYLLKVFQGISGVVRDAGTGAPLEASVQATATASPYIPVPHAYKEVFTDPAAGDYHRLLQPGTYSVTCSSPGFLPKTVQGVAVASDETTYVDFALGRPDLSVTASAQPSAGVAPLSVAFEAAVAGGSPPYSYAWAFGDGGTSQSPSPSHTFAAAGTYHPTVTVTDAAGSNALDSHLAVVVEAQPCTLECSASVPPSAVEGEAIAFSASAQGQGCSAASATFAWDFGDGEVSSQKNSRHAYASAGTYSWALTVRLGELTCAKAGTIRVDPPCAANCVAQAVPASGAAPLTVAFASAVESDHCAGSAVVAWDFGDGTTSSEASPSHTYAGAGTYIWTLMASVDGATCSRAGTVTAEEPCAVTCEAAASPAGPDQPFLVRFDAVASAAHCGADPSLSWDFGDGTTSSEASPEHIYAGPGSYAWTLLAAAGSAECRRGGTLSIDPQCTLACEASASPSGGSAPLSVAFLAAATYDHCDSEPTFAWEFGDGSPPASGPSASHTYGSPGSYAWTATASSGGFSCVRSGTVAVVEPPCSLRCEATALPEAGSSPLTVGFTSSVEASHCSGVPSYEWRFGDGGTSSEPNPTHLYARAGVFAWGLTVAQGGVTCTRTGSVSVSPGVPGDCDDDRGVTIGELQRAVNMFLEIEPPACGADCDGDGQLSIGEVQRVVNAFLGLPSGCG